ncbi:hypothetical protein L226DRAFT_559002 [Lentinus tigrinus ALCF2SS1-7]|uniref:DUF6534 domain-containing protein n=1 Tax=Lentinus tigrinus ALCF2SS1-6 TaxID=1328759 RepID=A0A5C2SG28_9APHY|nr:hypothetical protein L227DRAFT_599641 [Lentinus tigrinus ALCF2SS1-6]RPD78005.1 hypothetical protein L226DRAFT_559002 [Lentinus tigrinus ALCF2SS1-7]
MSDTVTAASSDDLAKTFGVLLIGFIFCVVLYGLTFFQTYIYFTRFPSDHFGTKWTVGLLWAVDTAATTLISHTIYRYLITSFMLAYSQLVTTKTFLAAQGLDIFLALVVQIYYAYRVYTVTDKRPALPAVISTIAAMGCALSIAGIAQSAQETLFADILTSRVKLLRGVGSALALVSDFIIVAAMFYYMQPTRNPGMSVPSGFYETAVVYCFNRATAFTAGQVISLIVFLTSDRHPAWVLVGWVASKLYANSLLAMLNFRNTHRGRGVNEEDSLNQHASNRSGSLSIPVGPRETARSVQFNLHPEGKTGDPMNIIELDMVPSRLEVYDDDVVLTCLLLLVSPLPLRVQSGKVITSSVDSGGPSKRHEFDDDTSR